MTDDLQALVELLCSNDKAAWRLGYSYGASMPALYIQAVPLVVERLMTQYILDDTDVSISDNPALFSTHKYIYIGDLWGDLRRIKSPYKHEQGYCSLTSPQCCPLESGETDYLKWKEEEQQIDVYYWCCIHDKKYTVQYNTSPNVAVDFNVIYKSLVYDLFKLGGVNHGIGDMPDSLKSKLYLNQCLR